VLHDRWEKTIDTGVILVRAGDLREGGCSGRALQGDEIPRPAGARPLGFRS